MYSFQFCYDYYFPLPCCNLDPSHVVQDGCSSHLIRDVHCIYHQELTWMDFSMGNFGIDCLHSGHDWLGWTRILLYQTIVKNTHFCSRLLSYTVFRLFYTHIHIYIYIFIYLLGYVLGGLGESVGGFGGGFGQVVGSCLESSWEFCWRRKQPITS